MRLGILGPANGDLALLARRAQHLVDEAQADRVIYLGDDDALDQVVSAWAAGIVGSDPAGEALFDRAAVSCADAAPDALDQFVARERARLRLAIFASLPRSPARTVEILDGRLVVLVHDKNVLDEDDIAAATLLVYGASEEVVVKRVGARTFVSPGPIALEEGGAALLDDGAGGVRIDVIAKSGKAVTKELVGGRATGKMRVQGGS